MQPRYIHGGAMAFLVVLTVTLPMTALGISINHVADCRWNDLERVTWNRLCAINRKDPRRPVLRGEPTPGNAWMEYLNTKAQPNSWTSFNVLEEYLNGRGDLCREEAQALLEAFLPSLRRAQAGAHRAEISRIIEWNADVPFVDGGWRQVTLGILQSRFLVEQGDVAEALDLLLDLMQFQADLGRVGRGFSFHTQLNQQQRILVELRSMMNAGLLNRDQLRQVSRELELLDRSLPTFGDLVRDLAMFNGMRVLRTKTVEEYLKDLTANKIEVPTWRFGFSQKLFLSNYAQLEFRMAEGIAQGDGRPWIEARQRTTDACAALAASRHPLYTLKGFSGGYPDWLPIHKSFLEFIAHFRLVRAAAHCLAEGTVPELKDPFGDTLKWSKSGAVTRIWSLGFDGLDQGGQGGWTGKSNPDIVVEIRH